ncbi:MAG: hypothetical protein HC852_19920 [Acaryochloridaceae cyanobacterium RU_4_10]|nr:hypothetical protein [Acaryochloridaceae cyanobacterium RU_4_10]
MMRLFKRMGQDESFLGGLKVFENILSKVLSLFMIAVILVAVVDLGVLLFHGLLDPPDDFLGRTLINIFGLFLNILIALEILENITAYLRQHVVQVELVIVTSITAVARKIIILDFAKTTGTDLIGLALAVFALSISYWIIRTMRNRSEEH